jgi:spore maturation protein SpmA
MVMNFSANLLGLDNAATPFGLKAMESLQSLNTDKETASDAQIMFLVLHTSGLTLIPLAIMAQRAVLGAQNPSDIFIPCLIATYVATVTGMLAVAIRQRINLWDRVLLGWLGGISAAIAAMVWGMSEWMTRAELETFSKVSANFLLLLIITGFIVAAMRKGVNVYDTFIEGAKGGIQTSLTIIPYLVGMLVAIGLLRNSGVLGLIVKGFEALFAAFGWNTDFVNALPTALMKPLSGSGARAMMVDTMKTFGVDSFAGRLACIFQGSADTHLLHRRAVFRLSRHPQNPLRNSYGFAGRSRRRDRRDWRGLFVLSLNLYEAGRAAQPRTVSGCPCCRNVPDPGRKPQTAPQSPENAPNAQFSTAIRRSSAETPALRNRVMRSSAQCVADCCAG